MKQLLDCNIDFCTLSSQVFCFFLEGVDHVSIKKTFLNIQGGPFLGSCLHFQGCTFCTT